MSPTTRSDPYRKASLISRYWHDLQHRLTRTGWGGTSVTAGGADSRPGLPWGDLPVGQHRPRTPRLRSATVVLPATGLVVAAGPGAGLAGGLGGSLARLLPIVAEGLDALVRQRVVYHLLEHLERRRGDVRAEQRRLSHVPRMADRRGQHFRLQVVKLDDRHQLADDVHAVLVDVVEAADKGRQQRRPGLGGQQALVGGEDERAVGLDAFLGEAVDGLQALLAHRHLDHDVGRQLGEVAALAQHALDVVGDDLGADRAGGDAADFDQHLVVCLAARPGEERRVGRHAIEHAPARCGADLFDVGRVQEDLHAFTPDRSCGAWYAAQVGGPKVGRYNSWPGTTAAAAAWTDWARSLSSRATRSKTPAAAAASARPKAAASSRPYAAAALRARQSTSDRRRPSISRVFSTWIVCS